MATKPIPDGASTVSPYLMIRGATQAIAFYQKVFGAIVRLKMDGPAGIIMHAELQIGNSNIMLADENPEHGNFGPAKFGGSPIALALYVTDVDAVFAKALAAGARQYRPLANQFYGDRSGSVIDPFGHLWHLSTHIEDVTPEEMKNRMASQMQHT
jgi:PhnB protein